MVSDYMGEYLYYEMHFYSIDCALKYIKYLVKKMSDRDTLDLFIENGLYYVTVML